MRNILSLFFLIFLLSSCDNDNPYRVDVSQIQLDLNVKRFEVDFYESSIKDLNDLKEKYPLFLPNTTADSIWIQKKLNRDEVELYEETKKIYKDFSSIERDLISLFQHVKYYYPNFMIPEVVTVNSNIDYDYRIIYNKKQLIISLDAYLGKEHPFYNDYPDYIKENNTKEFIIIDVAKEIANQFVPPNSDRTFLGKMIYQGKRQYLLDLFLPQKSEKLKSGYSTKKLMWIDSHEEQVWQYFIEKDLLYSTSSELDSRFLDIAPFSKFYLSLDNQSPGQVGKWIGWQIVRSFMEKNDVSLQSLLRMNTQELFKNSKYKPRD